MPEDRKKFVMFLVFLGLVILAIVVWSVSSYDPETVQQTYSSPFRKSQMKHIQNQQHNPQRYHPGGMRESDIRKWKGNRYDTF